jgi:hypothetical protein
MTKSIAAKIFTVAVCSLCISTSIFANSWWTRPYEGAKQNVSTLFVTANIDMPRILADVIQYSTRQPYLLVPARGEGKIFLCVAQKNAKEIREKDVTRFIDFINPQQIVVLGDAKLISPKYLKLLPGNQTVLTIYNDDWNQVAATLSLFLNKSNIKYDFKRLSEEYKRGKLYTPTPRKKNVVVDVVEQETEVVTKDAVVSEVETEAEVREVDPGEKAAPVLKEEDWTDAMDSSNPDEPGIILPVKNPELVKDK